MSKIDVHHHVYPQALSEAIARNGGDPSGWYIPTWTEASDRALSASIGVRTAILSVTAPGPSIEPDRAKSRELARQCNEYAAELKRKDPAGYGFFACLPDLLRDVEGALAEIKYSFEHLDPDGVVLYTSYGDDTPRYLGHKEFEPVWAELARRQAVVFVHPTHAAGSTLVNPSLPQPLFDYPHETGRAAMDLITQGTLRRHPGCKVILSHAGGTLPYLLYRVADALPHTPGSPGRSTAEIVAEGREFYFDTAIMGNPATLKALFEIARPGHVLFGSDYPNAPEEAIRTCTEELDRFMEEAGGADAVEYGAAVELFPRLAQSAKDSEKH